MVSGFTKGDSKKIEKIVENTKKINVLSSSTIKASNVLEKKSKSKLDLNKIKEEIEKRKQKNKTKDVLLADIADLQQLFNNQGIELKKIKTILLDAQGDLIIKNEILKEKSQKIETQEIQIKYLNAELGFGFRMEKKLDNIIEKMIKG